MTLTKADLAKHLDEEIGLTNREAKEIVELFFQYISDALINGQQVKISGFGNFTLHDKKERPGRNPFLEAGGLKPPEVMTGRSFMNVLHAEQSGQVDPGRTWVVTGRERHVADAREDFLPYPHRALRTPDFLYIRNFAPDRWPMGSPKFTSQADMPSVESLERDTMVAFADMDASPTKAWLVHQFGLEDYQWHYNYAFGKRPAEELYDLRKDPDEILNCASDPAYAAQKAELSARLLKILTDAKDPRVIADPVPFEHPPLAGPVHEGKEQKKKP